MPYAGHPNLITPDDNAVLWRYSDFAKFMDLIERRKLWFSRADKFEDPLEGTSTDAEVVYFRSLQSSASPELRGWGNGYSRVAQTTRATTFVNCWREGKFESMAMWDIYGKGSGIVAIHRNNSFRTEVQGGSYGSDARSCFTYTLNGIIPK